MEPLPTVGHKRLEQSDTVVCYAIAVFHSDPEVNTRKDRRSLEADQRPRRLPLKSFVLTVRNGFEAVKRLRSGAHTSAPKRAMAPGP